MKARVIAVCACLAGAALLPAAVPLAALSPVDKLPLAAGERAYAVADGEATVDDGLIRRIAIGKENVIASYKNTGEKPRTPNYTIRLYNRYGLLLGEDTVGSSGLLIMGGPPLIDPGDVATDELAIEWVPLDRVFRKSRLPLPEDWRQAAWVVLSKPKSR